MRRSARASASAAAKRAATHFDIPVVIERMEALYRELSPPLGTRNQNAIA